MKVVINNCYGGFSLSKKAIERYAELSGFRIFGYCEDYELKKIKRLIGDDGLCIYWLREDIGDNPSNEKLNKSEWFHDRDIKRDDGILIKVIEELRSESNGECANLKIIDIPDGVDYEICEYDGNEHIAEKHKIWY